MKNRNEPMLEPWQASYLRKAVKLRKRLTYKALAYRLGVSKATVFRYSHGVRG